METLDLHSIKHEDVEKMVEEFVILKNLPARIITGGSNTMKEIVTEVLERYSLRSEPENYWNLGSWIIYSEKP
jgi:hypothetical protein